MFFENAVIETVLDKSGKAEKQIIELKPQPIINHYAAENIIKALSVLENEKEDSVIDRGVLTDIALLFMRLNSSLLEDSNAFFLFK